MKHERFPIALIVAALLLVPGYGAAQTASPAGGGVTASNARTAAAVAAAVAKADAADAATAPATPATAATGAAAAAPVAPVQPPAPAIDPEAAAALKRSSEFLQSLKTFNVRVESSTDEVLDNGQKVQFGSVADISVIKPDHLRVDVVDDEKQRQFYYDGRTLTLYAKKPNYYASVKVPDTISKMLEFAESKYGLELPLLDLLAPEALAKNVKSGISLGTGRVRGLLCDHYAFRQDDVDWQIWIQKGKTPLPRKIVITTKNEAAAPQHASVLSWNLSPRLSNSAFRFVPPKSAGKIVFRELEDQTGNEK